MAPFLTRRNRPALRGGRRRQHNRLIQIERQRISARIDVELRTVVFDLDGRGDVRRNTVSRRVVVTVSQRRGLSHPQASAGNRFPGNAQRQ